MVVLNRISFLRRLAEFGAKCVFSVSVNPATGMQKIKVNVDPSVQIPTAQQFCTLQMIEFLSSLCLTHRVTDKGHKHSNGKSEVVFYIGGNVSDIASTEHPYQPDSNDAPCPGQVVHTADEPHQSVAENTASVENTLATAQPSSNNMPASSVSSSIAQLEGEFGSGDAERQLAEMMERIQTESATIHQAIEQANVLLPNEQYWSLHTRSATLIDQVEQVTKTKPFNKEALVTLLDSRESLVADMQIALNQAMACAEQSDSINEFRIRLEQSQGQHGDTRLETVAEDIEESDGTPAT